MKHVSNFGGWKAENNIMKDLKKVQEFLSKPMGEGYYEFDMEDEGPDYNSISSLEDELRRLIRFSNQSGSKGADAKIEQLKQRIAQLKNQVNEAKEDPRIIASDNTRVVQNYKRVDFK